MDNLFSIQSPDTDWLSQYFRPSLLASEEYQIKIVSDVKVKLDQNESPWDLPGELKEKVLSRVKSKPWNRYPTPFAEHLTKQIADYIRVNPDNILTGPGSNLLIAILMEAMVTQLKGSLILPQPSFFLYTVWCQNLGISPKIWQLDENLQYDLETIPLSSGDSNSMVIVASPNNPTGTSLSSEKLDVLLTRYPDTLFVADQAYCEFADDDYVPLLAKHSNLIIVRTFSKTMGSAGVRFGFLVSSSELIRQLIKQRLPYLLNHFTVEAAMTLLQDDEAGRFLKGNIEKTRKERVRVYDALTSIVKDKEIQVVPSQANFHLLRWASNEESRAVYHKLIDHGILIRDVSKGAGLEGCLRVSLGTVEENDAFLAAFKEIV